MSQPATTCYDPLSRAFHWIAAVLVLIGFSLGPDHFGRLMKQGVDPATRGDIVWHESIGALIFVLTLMRLLWVAFRPAAPRFQMRAGVRIAARMMHVVLWALMLLLPLTALMALGSEGHPLTLLGGIRVDKVPIIAGDSLGRLADWGDVHKFLGDALIWLACLHGAAAIFHHVILRDGVLLAMTPFRKRLP
jgi:cytochrome b561